jgi:hypothetical protein
MESGAQNALTLINSRELVLLLPLELTVERLGQNPALLWALDGFDWQDDPQGLRSMRACLAEVSKTKRVHDSFAMHAPLELMARMRIDSACQSAWSEATRGVARLQAVATALAYREQGLLASQTDAPGHAGHGIQSMQAAIDAGDVQGAQAAAKQVALSHFPLDVIKALAPDWSLRLPCGAHAALFLSHLAHVVEAVPSLAAQALQALPLYAGELARAPMHRVAAERLQANAPTRPGSAPQAPVALRSALLALRPLPGAVSGSIQAIVQQALDAGMARDLMPLIPQAQALESSESLWLAYMAAVCEVPLRSILEDAPAKAKYGWTHALTLPMAAWHLASLGAVGRHQALAMTTLQVAAFRAVIGSGPLPAQAMAPALSGLDPVMDETFEGLFAQACTRPDAHLVKYVLACQDLGQMAPSLEGLGCLAAKHLTAIWVQEQPDAGLLTSLSLR